jgi:transcriptional regulator with XRE-family HTH domain
MEGILSTMRIDGEKLMRLRLEKFLNREELAERSGIHRDHIGRLERGDWKGESRPKTVRMLAEGLEIDPHELLEDESL